MEPTVILALIIGSIAGFAAAGGLIASCKRRNPLEGVCLGLLLGPLGVLIESRNSFRNRPPVDRPAWRSYRSLTVYQANDRAPDSRRHAH